jgi:hypothetical protein
MPTADPAFLGGIACDRTGGLMAKVAAMESHKTINDGPNRFVKSGRGTHRNGCLTGRRPLQQIQWHVPEKCERLSDRTCPKAKTGLDTADTVRRGTAL